MKKIALSLITTLAVSTFAYAGGDIAPVEPVVEVPVVEETPSAFYVGIGYSYFDATYDSIDVTGNGMLGLVGYKFNDYLAIEGRYSGTLNGLDMDVNIANNIVPDDKKFRNAALYVKGMYPVGAFGIYGLLGYGQTNANDMSDEGFQYGIGASYSLNDNVGLFVDYTRLYDDSGLNYVGDIGDYTIDTFNFGVSYSF